MASHPAPPNEQQIQPLYHEHKALWDRFVFFAGVFIAHVFVLLGLMAVFLTGQPKP
jgi:hypothetical protein